LFVINYDDSLSGTEWQREMRAENKERDLKGFCLKALTKEYEVSDY